MISNSLMGGLGNQLFQIATGMAHAYRLNTKYKVDYRNSFTPNQGNLAFRYSENIFRNIDAGTLPRNLKLHNEESFNFTLLPKESNLFLNGYFQSWKYFEDFKEVICNKLQIPSSILLKAREILVNHKINPELFNAIHVRRGDYLKFQNTFEILDRDYYSRAISILNNSNRPFLVVSDEIDYAIRLLNNPSFYYIKSSNELIDFAILNMSKSSIISNSSFAWWANYLSMDKQKTTIAPLKWFTDKSINTNDLIPLNWFRI